MWLRVDSPASLSPSPASAKAPETTATCGPPSARLWARLDQDTYLPKTCQDSFPGMVVPTLHKSSKTWPRSGLLSDGRCWELTMSVPRTGGSGCGFWPSPVANDDNKTPEAHLRMKQRMGERDGTHANRTAITSLQVMVKATERGMWPTPTQRDYKDGSAQSCANVPTNHLLGRAVHGGKPTQRTYPTPKQNDHKPGIQSHNDGRRSNLNDRLAQPHLGQLNPAWVEWLMGWPIGWTDCAPLATDRFQRWLRLHGDYLVGGIDGEAQVPHN